MERTSAGCLKAPHYPAFPPPGPNTLSYSRLEQRAGCARRQQYILEGRHKALQGADVSKIASAPFGKPWTGRAGLKTRLPWPLPPRPLTTGRVRPKYPQSNRPTEES